jgi:hypothetical protein
MPTSRAGSSERLIGARPGWCATFLATWAVELAVHHLDLGYELTMAAPSSPALRLARLTIEALVNGKLPAAWADDMVVLLGSGRVRPGLSQIEACPLAEKLPVLG